MSFRNLVAAVCLMISAITSVGYAQDAVQWKVEDGGNGHWYLATSEEFLRFQIAQEAAESVGAHLATLTTLAENDFAAMIAPGEMYLGGYQDLSDPSYQEPDGGWKWITGEEWNFENWHTGEPNNVGDGEQFLTWWRFHNSFYNGTWNDAWNEDSVAHRALWEWSADCNGDGLVDYGQILSGDLEDMDSDGVPDECQECEADLDGNGQLDFFDISGFLVFYQLGDITVDFTGDGQLNFFDVSAFLNAFNAGCP